jgi:hypothetical protein
MPHRAAAPSLKRLLKMDASLLVITPSRSRSTRCVNFTSTAVVSTASPANRRVPVNGMTRLELSETASAKFRLVFAVLLVSRLPSQLPPLKPARTMPSTPAAGDVPE